MALLTPTVARTPAAAPASTQTKPGDVSLRRLARLRIALQLATLALVLAPLWWPRMFKTAAIYRGNYAASQVQIGSWFLPLADPFTSLSAFASARALPWTLASGALLVLGLYLLARARTFCAYACPVHLVLETWDKLIVKLGLRRDGIGAHWPRWLNKAVAAALLVAAAVAGLPLFEPVNPVNTLIRSLQHLTLAGLGLVAAVMLLEACAGRRVFCRHLCPIGGFYSALNRAGVAGVAVDPSACTGCFTCVEHCLAAPELQESITQARNANACARVESPHCTVCFECAAVCEHHGMVFQNRWKRMAGEVPRPSPRI